MVDFKKEAKNLGDEAKDKLKRKPGSKKTDK